MDLDFKPILNKWDTRLSKFREQKRINKNEYKEYVNVKNTHEIINTINNLLNNNKISVIECIELLEEYETDIGSNTIYIKKHNIILPNLANIQESKSVYLPDAIFSSFMDKLLSDYLNSKDILNSHNSFNPNEKICSFSSDILDDYFIKLDFANYEYRIPKNFIDKFKMCNINDPNIRFYIIPLSLRKDYGQRFHANMLIIDNKNKLIEFFEPHGKKYYELEDYDMEHHLNAIIEQLFKDLNPDVLKYTYVNVHHCVKDGLQTIQNRVDQNAGHCLAWSLLYTHIRLYNISMSSDDIIKFFTNILSPAVPARLDKYMKRYISYVENFYENYGKSNIKDVYSFHKLQAFLTNDEKDKVKQKIIVLTKTFMLHINNEDRRSYLLKRILRYQQYPDFHNIFSDILAQNIPSPSP